MLPRAAPPICGRLILLLSAVLTDSCVVDAPTPLAALETTPRPTRLVFGDGGPDAVALTVDLVSTIGCGESAWCAELLPLHFAAARKQRLLAAPVAVLGQGAARGGRPAARAAERGAAPGGGLPAVRDRVHPLRVRDQGERHAEAHDQARQ